MGTYEIVDWIRSIRMNFRHRTPDFNVETLVQIVYDKELTGRQLQSKEVKAETLASWFADSPDIVPDESIQAVIQVMFEQLTLRLEKDAKCKSIKPKEKRFNIPKLEATLFQLKQRWGYVKQQIVGNTLDVETVQQYFGMLKNEDAGGVLKELTFALNSYSNEEQRGLMASMKKSARSIVMVFDCLSALEAAKYSLDAVQLFQKLLREAPESKRQKLSDDRKWKERMELLTADYSKYTVTQMDPIYQKTQTMRTNLSEDQRKWLSLIASNRKCITQLYTKFHDDAEFEKHMQIFGTSDPIQQTRAMALTNVRNSIITFLNHPNENMTHLSKRLGELSQSITANDVSYLEIVVTSWSRLLVDTFDATQYKFQQDKDTLAQLTQFTFFNEADQTKDGLQYLQAILGEAKQDEEQQMQQTLTQNEFDAFTDRLLMFMAGDQGNANVGDAPIRPIAEMKTRDVVDLLKSRKQTLMQCGLPQFADLEQILAVKHVTGRDLVVAYEAVKHTPEAMHDLLFDENQLLDTETEEKIADQISKVIESQVLRNKVQDDIIPKFDLCKKIAKHRLLYYSEGGRIALEQNRFIDVDKTMEEFEQIERDWKRNVLDWKHEIEKLRRDFKVLTFYTVNDMRWIIAKIQQYINPGEDAEKEKYLRELHSSLCFIDPTLELDECQQKITELWQKQQPHKMQELGKGLQSAFGDRLRRYITLKQADYQYLAPGKPHLFYWQQIDAILRTVMKLFLSQQQQPAASRVLFCSRQTTLEEVECLLMRSNLGLNRLGNPLLHVMVQPERLQPEIQDGFLQIMNKYVYGSRSLFAIVTADSRNKIYHQLSAFANYTQRPFTETERRQFFKHILCSDPDQFHTGKNEAPLCAVYLSQTECVGKSHVIQEKAKHCGHALIHVPINTRTTDLDFIVDRLMSVPKQQSAKTVFHINVSSDAARDVNDLMFKLLVLRFLRKSSGGCFTANASHAFLVELPSQITSTLEKTDIHDVREYFYFLAGSKSFGISKFEVQDALRLCDPIVDPRHVISNRLDLTAKEMFVLKYLNAFDMDQLVITGKAEDNWDHSQHPDIDDVRRKELISKYCQRGAGSIVFLKSFLRYMYRQLIQLYTAFWVKNENSFPMDGRRKFIQYHKVIAESMIQSAPHIACHMYDIPKIATERAGLADDDEKNMDESTGDEVFFLVEFWANATNPMVLMNQRPIKEAKMLKMDATTLEKDLENAEEKNESTFSLLAMNLDKSNSYGAQQWKLYRQVMKQAKSLHWKLYNFEEDQNERLQQLKEQGFANETASKQKEKLQLLMRICGGFTSADPKKQEDQLDKLYNANKDYALTFDNILKIVAIFFRVNSGIPVLIMGETGCGKTKLLSFMSIALGIKMFTIDVHGGYLIADLHRDLTKRDEREPQVDGYDPGPIQYAADNPTKTVLVFLDEVNTSLDVGGFKEVICDHSLKGEDFPENMVIIAALNPYRRRHKTKEQLEEEEAADANNPKHFVDELDRQMGSLVYRVFPLPPSLKTYVWNFGALSQMDEQQYIAVMTRTTWADSEFRNGCPHTERAFQWGLPLLTNCFIELICKSQQFLRNELNDKSVCSLRDVKRANCLFLWFFQRKHRMNKPWATRILESMLLAITQCYYYRLNQGQRDRFENEIESTAKSKLKRITADLKLMQIIDAEQDQYVYKLRIGPGIAINRAFKENLFVMLVGISTETPTVIVGRPGSSKTLAMVTLQDNLLSSTKREALTEMGFDDYFVLPFQCSKLTTAASIEKRWEFAEEYEKRLNERQDQKNTLVRKVIMFLDEVGLAEQSPHRPLKVLHKLLENPKIAFIGLSNWTLDSAKMNRVVLHNVLPPSKEDLKETAEKIMKGTNDDNYRGNVSSQLEPKIPKIAAVYESILNDKELNPFGFDFFGHRDFYNLVNYLKYRLSQPKVSLEDDSVLEEAILRNFGGETKQQAEKFLLPKIAEHILSTGNVDEERLWREFNPLSLIRDNIRQTRDLQRPKTYEIRNIMLITDSPVMWKILFDADILQIADTEIIFGSKFKNDMGSTIYLYRTIERVRGAMQSGRVCVLLKLDQLYDSLYDMLNQRYLNVDNQKFCKICIGGESISCQIHHTFRCIVVQSRDEAHHESNNTDDWTPVAFLNRFEKQYLDPGLLQQYGIGGDGWSRKLQLFKAMIDSHYDDHSQHRNKDLFIGYNQTYSFVSLLTTEAQSEHIEHKEEDDEDEWVDTEQDEHKINVQESIDECYNMLLRTTSIQYLIQDQRKKPEFKAFASLIDLLQREGVQPESTRHMLLRVVTHDTYQLPLDFKHKVGVKDYDGARVDVVFDHDSKVDQDNNTELKQKTEGVHVLKFKEITSFVRELDFYNYVYDFFNGTNSMENTLIIICDPANTNEQLVHYLHAQYLCEKARAAAQKPNQNQGNGAKNIVFLIYMSRQSPYPLIFNREWKHLFLDALLPADHQMFPQIPVNDINVFEKADQIEFKKRVIDHIDRIVFDSFEKAMNSVGLSKVDAQMDGQKGSAIRDEIERIKHLLDVDCDEVEDAGRLRVILAKRIQRILVDEKTGAIDCLNKTLKDRKRSDRGSIRSHVMEKLAEKIGDQLVEILTIIFSNGNSRLYFGDMGGKYGDVAARRVVSWWLKLVSEPRILRIERGGTAKSKRRNIDLSLRQAQFPFSSHIHSYMLSYKDDCLKEWKVDGVPVIESGQAGQTMFSTELENKLHAANLSVRIDNLPKDLVRKLSTDIVQLEATRLGLRRHGTEILPHIIKFVHEFLWKSSNDSHEAILKRKKPRKDQRKKLESGNVGGPLANADDTDSDESDSDDDLDFAPDSYDEDSESGGNGEIEATDDEKVQDEEGEVEEDEEEEEYLEHNTVQIHEIYATLWANEKIILQSVDVFSALRQFPLQLETLNKLWEKHQNLPQTLSFIMTQLLDEVEVSLKQAGTQKLQERASYLLSISQSFNDFFNFLDSLEYNQQTVRQMREKWNIIRLAMICVSACPERIGGDFISELTLRFQDHRFDDLGKLGGLLQLMGDALSQSANPEDTLQWFCQNYIRFFAFSAQDTSEKFTQSLIQVIAEEKEQQNTDLNLIPNAFTKFEVASQFLSKIDTNEPVKTILETQVEDRELKSLIACLLSRASEQRLHHDMRSKYMGDSIAAPKGKEVETAVNKLHASFEGNKLEQVLAISECKVILHYFIRYLLSILEKPKSDIDEKGIWFKKRHVKKAKYLSVIGQILKIEQGCTPNVRAIKQGLQYFFVSELWNRGGAQNTMTLMSKSVFSKVMNVELFKEDTLSADYIPKDDTFLLALSYDDEKMADEAAKIYQQFEQSVMKDTHPQVAFKRMNYVQLFGAIFNKAYLRGGVQQFEHIAYYINDSVNQDLKNEKAPNCKQRLRSLLISLITNNWQEKMMELNKKRTLEDIQMIRLCIHFVAVILSLPPNPFSRLFHNPMDLVQEYLPGMPEDSSAALLKVMAGHGVWLCPNDHIYFVGECTATRGSGTCHQCGVPIGNDTARGMHTPAKGNRRIGRIDKNGVIRCDTYGKGAAGMAEYEKLAPKGYVMVEGVDEVVRGLNEIYIEIVRWMINAILFVHGSELQTSTAGKFMRLSKDEVIKKLKKMLNKSFKRLGLKLNLSFESVTYLMHQIIHNFYMRFHRKWADAPIPRFTEPKMRLDFETWLVQECIQPVTQNTMEVIVSVRQKVTTSLVVLKWSKCFEERMDLASTEGREFASEYLPNIFLPFRLLTLSTFKEMFLQSGSNKKNYPVTWGILNTIDTAAGYSVFALKHLPAMITWMKLLKQRLNQRLNLDEVLADSGQYSCKWVMDRCANEGWGDINVWAEAFNGFVEGWNHLAQRVTTQEEMENVAIDTVDKGTIYQRDPNSDEKEETKQNEEDIQEDEIKMIRKNEFKKFVKIANVCEMLPIKPFVSKSAKGNAEVKPVDVPLVFGMDSGQDGKLDTSIMIRKIVQHYVSVNNRVIGECYQLGDNDDEKTSSKKRELGLDPGLDSSYISREKDVVDIDEEELREIIQQCFQQKLRYGADIPDAVNWRLLESRLRERYITGRKLIFENPIYFEFAGQFNIPIVLQKIDRQHAIVLQADPEKETYFEEVPHNLLEIVKLNLRQRAAVSQDNVSNDHEHDDFIQGGNAGHDRRNQQSKQRLLDAYSNAKSAVEHTLVALQRQKNLPEKGFSLGTYMKDNLHLYPKEYDPFIRTQLQLKHLGPLWRFLEKTHLIEQGTWHEIPKTTMELYRTPINDQLKTGIRQFITMYDMDALWKFLSAFRRFLETMCRTQLSQKPDQESLVHFLSYAEDVDEELVYNFPPGIKLNQAGFAYFHAAKEYQKRNDREPH